VLAVFSKKKQVIKAERVIGLRVRGMEDEAVIALIQADAALIQTQCEEAGGNCDSTVLIVAREAAKRILDSCSRVSKRAKLGSPVSTPSSSQDQDENRSELMELSRKAGDFVIPFGRYQGKHIKSVPPTYLCWLMGAKREGRNFTFKTDEALNWTRSRHAVTLAHVHNFLVWRCWACGSQDMRFKHARLCTSCWHDTD
jgi:uncharacterized protein (DUF3820 family)